LVRIVQWGLNPQFTNEREYPEMTFNHYGLKILSLFRYWNIVEYYFPYKNLIEEDWDSVLFDFIPRMLKVRDKLSYELLLLELIGRISDSHANIYRRDETLRRYFGVRSIPVDVTYVKRKWVVSGFTNEQLRSDRDLKYGDIILAIDGTPVEQIVMQKSRYFPASNGRT
jgi:hypothetical protein